MNEKINNILKAVKKFSKAQIALFIAAALLFISIFIPLMTPKKEAKRDLRDHIEMAEMMDNKSMEDECEALLKPSTTKLFSAYVFGLLDGRVYLGEAALMIAPTVALSMLLIIAIAVLAILRKPLPVAILAVINLVVLIIRNSVFSQIFMERDLYKWAFGNAFMIIAVILVAAAAVYGVIDGKKQRKQ